MGAWLTPDDLAPFETIDAAKAAAMIEDAEAQATMAAPCLGDAAVALTATQQAAVKSVLRRAVLRWNDTGNAGSRSSIQQTAGPFGQTQAHETTGSRGLFWPSEITDLQAVCRAVAGLGGSRAFAVDTVPTMAAVHSPICALYFGATYCSCGSDINNLEGPLYEGGLLS